MALELFSIQVQNVIYSKIINPKISVKYEMPSEADLNKLWLSVRPSKGFSLVRDFLYWKHRYADHPHSKYQFISFYSDKDLIALAVTRKSISRLNNSAIAIVEWMNEDSFRFGQILASTLNLYKNSNVNYFYVWLQSLSHNASIANRNFFFLKKQAPIIFADNLISRDLLENEKDMIFFLGSSDAI